MNKLITTDHMAVLLLYSICFVIYNNNVSVIILIFTFNTLSCMMQYKDNLAHIECVKTCCVIKFYCIGKMNHPQKSIRREFIIITKWLLVFEKILKGLNTALQITTIHRVCGFEGVAIEHTWQFHPIYI